MTITQASLVCVPGISLDLGRNVFELLHGDQASRFLASPSIRAEYRRSLEIASSGRHSGDAALFEFQGMASLESGEPMVSWAAKIHSRGDNEADVMPRPIPMRTPDIVDRAETRPDQAMFYWLNHERELVHVDPSRAEKSGMLISILHDVCTASIACRAILRRVCDYDALRVADFDLRWSKPVIPGETIETIMWIDNDLVSFRCIAVERSQVVIDHGQCKLHKLSLVAEGSA